MTIVRLLVGLLLVAGCGRLGFSDTTGGAPASDGRLDVGNGNGDAGPTCAFRLGAGRQHLSAVFPDGTARVWGYGGYGQIGDGMMADRSVPTPVTLPAQAVSTAAGRYETCVALSTGEARCWGEGDSGQLGDGNGVTSSTQVIVANLTTVVEVAAAAIHACARTSNGEVWCWGNGASGRLGTGNMTTSLVPVRTINLPAVKQLIAGGSTSCAIVAADDTARCWGYNQLGTVGNNTFTDVVSPVEPIGLGAVRAITSRDISSCGVQADGNVMCWGGNADGQCGIGSFGGNLAVPTQVVTATGPLGGAREIGMGIVHGCALLDTGEVWCWGRNQYGQLGDGAISTTGRPTAARVIGLPSIVHIGVAAWTNCALDVDGGVWCWGLGLEGELGDGTLTAMQPTPVRAFTACP